MVSILVPILATLSWAIGTGASACNGAYNVNFTCPAKGGFYCEGANSLASNVIFRCIDGCPFPGNCNDDLFCYPPGTGVKQGAFCYQDSPTAGNAQCTFNCVNVTQVDGEVFYPLGCASSLLSTQTAWLSACVTGGTKESMMPLPSGIIHSSTGSHAATTTKSSSAFPTPATAGSSAGTPTATGGSSDPRERLAGTILLGTFFVILMLLVTI